MSAPDQDRLVVRAYKPEEDKNFILNSWLKSYRRAPASQYIPNEIYFPAHKALIESLLADPATSVKVLVLDDADRNFIVGYSVTALAPPVFGGEVYFVHWVYIKDTFRGLGLTKALLPPPGSTIRASHMTQSGNVLAQRKGIVYDPYILAMWQD